MAQNTIDTKAGKEFKIIQNMLNPGKNNVAIVGVSFKKKYRWDTTALATVLYRQ